MERNPALTKLARQLCINQTKEEALLWYNFLSKYPVRFHRQFVIGNYIADFYCHQGKIVVELDMDLSIMILMYHKKTGHEPHTLMAWGCACCGLQI